MTGTTDDKAARRAAALRANLQRRKARGRAVAAGEDAPVPADAPPPARR